MNIEGYDSKENLFKSSCGDMEDMFNIEHFDDPMVKEADPEAAGRAYKADTTKVDQAKFPQHKAT